MDYLDQRVIDSIRRNASARAEELFTQPIDVLFYDTTTLYFQSDREDYGQKKDPLRFKGYSKDGKPHRTQVVLALLVTRGGIPLDYELYPGHTYEGDTLCRALDGITERYDVSRVTVVADAGLFSHSNLEWLRERNLPYIVGFRAKNATRKLKEQILDADGYEGYMFDQDGEAQCRCKIIARGEERIIATYSKKRARKDRHSRERALEKLLKRLKRSAKPLSLVSKGHAGFSTFHLTARPRSMRKKWHRPRAGTASTPSSPGATISSAPPSCCTNTISCGTSNADFAPTSTI